MKVNEGFVLTSVAGSDLVVATGKATKTLNGYITLNPTAKIMWEVLEKGCTEQDLVNAILEKYDIDEATATRDVRAFVEKLSNAGVISL